MNYKSSGVDIDRGEAIVANIKKMLGEAGATIGHFGGAIPFPVNKYKNPLLISSVDGVGTKVKVATAMKKYNTIGMDLVHHCINDIACCGAEPLAFLDYIAASELDVDVTSGAISGIVEACKRWNVTLVGGETAEMPSVYQPGEFDLAGTVIGVVEKEDFIDGKTIADGDVIVGFPSVGLHTNGYSLARKVLEPLDYNTNLPELNRCIGDELLTVHRCYLDEFRFLKANCAVKGLAHITGGGLEGNISRIIPAGLKVSINWGTWPEPPIFGVIRNAGQVPEEDMRRTFNLGIGLTAIMAQPDAKRILTQLPGSLLQPIIIGKVTLK